MSKLTDGEIIAGQACEIVRLKKEVEKYTALYDEEFSERIVAEGDVKHLKKRLGELLTQYETLDAVVRNKNDKIGRYETEISELRDVLANKIKASIPEGMSKETGNDEALS